MRAGYLNVARAATVLLATVGVVALSTIAGGESSVASAEAPDAPCPPSLSDEREAFLAVKVRVTAIDGLMEGDATMDGTTNIVDAMFVAQYTVGLRDLDEWQRVCADTNDDNNVNIVDAMHIAQYTVDPIGSGGVLFEPLWMEPEDSSMLPPA